MRLTGRAIALTTALFLGGSGAATAATFTVDSTGNSSDSSIGNGVCRTSGGVCTLRAHRFLGAGYFYVRRQ